MVPEAEDIGPASIGGFSAPIQARKMPPDAADEVLTDLGLALVYSPARVKLEVVFIHGLNGSRSGTWTNSDGELWPAWLGDSVPGSRVWTYGYNSAVWNTPTEDAMELHTARLLEECARRQVGKEDALVVFVCHSLGGILTKSVGDPDSPY